MAATSKKRDLTKMKTPHTYVIIFGVVIMAWILTFLIPAGKFSTEEVAYQDANGETSTRTVLRQDTFRYDYALDKGFVYDQLEDLANDPAELDELGIAKADVEAVLAEGEANLTQSQLDELSLTDDVLYDMYGNKIYDTSKNSTRRRESGGRMISVALAS